MTKNPVIWTIRFDYIKLGDFRFAKYVSNTGENTFRKISTMNVKILTFNMWKAHINLMKTSKSIKNKCVKKIHRKSQYH